jgi:hypothetical protein
VVEVTDGAGPVHPNSAPKAAAGRRPALFGAPLRGFC